MSIAFRSKTESPACNDNVGSLVVTLPAGVVSGDLLIVIFNGLNSTVNGITPPAGGWTLRTTLNQTVRGSTYTKLAGGSEPSTYNFATVDTGYCDGAVMAYSGCDPTTPVTTTATADDSGSVTSHSMASVTTTVANSVIVSYWGNCLAPLGTLTDPSGMARRLYFSPSGCFAVEDITQAATGASAAETLVSSTAGQVENHVLVLAPPAGAPALSRPTFQRMLRVWNRRRFG